MPTVNYDSFGWRLYEARAKANLSLKELAAASGVHWVTIADFERNTQQPGLAVAVKLADALGLTLDELLTGSRSGLKMPRVPRSQNPVRHLREKIGVTGKHLAATAGLSQPYLHAVETGRRGLSAAGCLALAMALRVPADGLARRLLK